MSETKHGVVIEDASDDDEYTLDDPYSNVQSHSYSSPPRSSVPSTAPPPAASLSPQKESSFEHWLRVNVNQPVLHALPQSIHPNHISYCNTAVCWLALGVSATAYKYEHVYPYLTVLLRLILAFLIFSGIVLDCLDGMQARRTNRCTKLGEFLDHSLDAANIPILCCCMLMTLQPDIYTVIVSLVGGGMVYNAQLVIYRHNNVFILPPLTGPEAQMLCSVSTVAFAFFFLYFDRHLYLVEVFMFVFMMVGNMTQLNNCWWYFKQLKWSFAQSCVEPHARFIIISLVHGLLPLFGVLTPYEYMISAIFLNYRLNGTYVLDTLATRNRSKEIIRAEDNKWHFECFAWVFFLFLSHFVLMPLFPAFHPIYSLLPHLFCVNMVVLNVRELLEKLPLL